jgi:hypothetical protein
MGEADVPTLLGSQLAENSREPDLDTSMQNLILDASQLELALDDFLPQGQTTNR